MVNRFTDKLSFCAIIFPRIDEAEFLKQI